MKKQIIIPVLLAILIFTPILAFAANETLENPLGNTVKASQLVTNIIKAMMAFLGALATLMFIFGGFTLILSAGNPEQVKKGQKTIVWAVVGIVIVLSAYGIMNWVFDVFTSGRVT